MAKGDGVLGKNRRWITVRAIISFLMAVILTWGLAGCRTMPFAERERVETSAVSETKLNSRVKLSAQLSEVAPPQLIQKLNQSLEAYQPQVTIISPQADQVFQDTTVSVQLQVQDLPIFQDSDLGTGPHLEVVLDNQSYTKIYDLNESLVLSDLEPGTHTLRIFAARPWLESFKNEGAYAQTTFHIFTKTDDNNPDPALPLLTYNSPTGSYGAEPILLDFYLTSAPLHLIAAESSEDDVADWRIRVTVNGQSFILDHWQSVYLKGFKPGKNWVQLEFLDEQGNPLKNVFNNTVRLISYEPNGKDTLSQLVDGELDLEVARRLVEPNYQTKLTPTPSPTTEPTAISPIAPAVEETPTSEPVQPEEAPIPEAELAPPQSKPTEQPKSGGIFSRFLKIFRRPNAAPSPSPEVPEELEAPTVAPVITPEKTEPAPEPEAVTPEPTTAPEKTVTPEPETPTVAPVITPKKTEPAPELEGVIPEPLTKLDEITTAAEEKTVAN
ncbi:hypothetical protein [Lyngbya aestuarii]|uniref:hypothetical protein n=1 Tax=Lyngbya aestuarii TaxID=118322 RepID=UPI00403DF439